MRNGGKGRVMADKKQPIAPHVRIRIKGRYAAPKDLVPGASFAIDGVLRDGDGPGRKLQTFRVVDWRKEGE